MPPKKASEQSKGSNKIRFVMLEADLSDGNLGELTQAITNALKPTSSVRYITSGQSRMIGGSVDAGGPDVSGELEDEPATEPQEESIVATPAVLGGACRWFEEW